MDRETLLANPDQSAHEPTPTAAPLAHLTDDESALYRELIDNTHGERVRLEQERVGYPLVLAAIAVVTA